ncbi:MAG: alpha/beta hydrolase [Reyranellaceae bacterium]
MNRRRMMALAAGASLTARPPEARGTAVTTPDGQRLSVLDRGQGRPVVLIHGWSLGAEIWQLQVDSLVAAGLRVVAYDRRGHAGSDKPGNGYDFDILAADLAAVLKQRALRDVVLVGHSMGAGEVARYLARFGRDRIARAALVAPTTPFALRTPDNPEGVEGAVYDKMVSALQADPDGYLAAGAPGFFGRNAEPELVEWGLALARRASLPALVQCLRAFSRTDFRPDMAAFALPSLIVWGSGDAPSMASNVRRTAAAIPGSRTILYEGAPHGLFLTEAARFNRDLIGFARADA